MNLVRKSYYTRLYIQLPAVRRKYNWYLAPPSPQVPPPYQQHGPSREGVPDAVNTQGLREKPEHESSKEVEQCRLPTKMVRPVIHNKEELATALADLSHLFSRNGRPRTLKSLTDALMGHATPTLSAISGTRWTGSGLLVIDCLLGRISRALR
jgi:hypothetical protein